ncbi:MAG: hypothetical protein QW609_03455 [Candidatus Aenigmatarchaeota archaeon]
MFIFSIFDKIFKKKESEEKSEKVEEEFQKIVREDSLRNVSIEKEEKEMLNSGLKPGPLTEKFFEITQVKKKKEEE